MTGFRPITWQFKLHRRETLVEELIIRHGSFLRSIWGELDPLDTMLDVLNLIGQLLCIEVPQVFFLLRFVEEAAPSYV